MIVGSATIVVNAMTAPFVNQVNRSMRSINGQALGANFGSAFSKGATGGMAAFTKKAQGTYQAINKLIEGSYYLQTGLIALAGVVGASAGGLFAFGSSIASAAPSLIVFVGLISTMISAMITLKIAMSGVMAAIGKLWKGQDGAAKSQAKANAIYDAQLRISRLAEDYVEAKIKSSARIKEAEEKLIKVRETALEQLQQLNFKAQDAAIGEKKAGIELEKAREALARVQDMPPNSRVRREAELAYAEAELNLRKAKDANKDLAKESTIENAKFAKSGVEGLEDVIDATKDVQEAKNAQAAMERDNLRSSIDAEKALKRAKEDTGGGGGADPLAGLSKEASDFVKYIISIKEELLGLRNAAGEKLFPKLQEAIEILRTKGFGTFKIMLTDTGEALGIASVKIAKAITEARNLKNLLIVNSTVNDTIIKAGDIFRNLWTILLDLLSAADPLIRRFTDWLVVLTGGWSETLALKNETGELTEFFNKAGDVAAQLGDIIGNLFGTLMNLGKAAAGPGSGGQTLLDSLEGITEKWKIWTGTVEGQTALRDYFKKAADIFMGIAGFIKDIIALIIRIGTSKGMQEFVDGFRKGVGHIGDALQKVAGTGTSGIFGQFIENMGKVIAFTIESGSVQMYFGILITALDMLVKLLENPVIGKIFTVLAAVHGARMAFGRIGSMIQTVGQYAYGALDSVLTFGSKVAGLGGTMTTMGSAFMNGALKMPLLGSAMTSLAAPLTTMGMGVMPAFVVALASIVAIVVIVVAVIWGAYENSEIFRKSLSDLWHLIKDNLQAGLDKIKEAFAKLGFTVGDLTETFKKIGDFLGTYVVPLIGMIFGAAIGVAVDAIIGLIKIVAGIISVFKAVWDFIKVFWYLFTGEPGKAFDAFTSMLRNLITAAKNIFGGMFDIFVSPFKFAFNLIAKMWNATVGKFSFTVPGWVPGVGGKSFKMPTIPEWGGTGTFSYGAAGGGGGAQKMAKGGTVYPSPGGTLVRIAEAGRPERVEPLDPDGLSKRDKAIMQANAGNVYITVNPAAGMNETELASMVSRQLAWQLRKGVA